MGDKKNDMDRVGVFQEMGYISIGDKYKTAGVQFNVAASKGKQVLPGGSKEKSALQHGYFAEKFNRVMEGEAYSDPIKMRRQRRLEDSKKNLSKAFLPSSGDKKMSGLGSHYGTLGGPIPALSPGEKASKPYKSPGKNVMTNPGKEGTGFGYLHVTLGKYPAHMIEPYHSAQEKAKKESEGHRKQVKGGAFRLNMHPQALFDSNPYRSEKALPPVRKSSSASQRNDVKPFKPSSPGKHPGGSKIGTFDPYPSHSQDPYNVRVKRQINVVNKSGRIFVPSQGPKTTPCISIVNQHVKRTINIQNYRSATLA
ncbi:cilia-and flagella-associated protein 96-like isoform X2 [Haliotis cracherodii]|uniref:cilia-and flagella-associated protein 96-like isoform X2 n=1 Tax=Haliotis cracherodii TaxID=6455 RepID=UPI0039ED70AA